MRFTLIAITLLYIDIDLSLIEYKKAVVSTEKHTPDTDDDTDDEMEKPEMINWRKYNVRDNGQDILDMKLRNALKTINAKPETYFKA